jgi:hypothetical protein
MLQKFLIPIILIACFFSVEKTYSQKNKISKKYVNPFDTLKYDKVIAFDYNGSTELQIVMNGQLLPQKNRIFNQKELKKNQVNQLNNILGNKKSYGGNTASCFDPHFGIIYFYQNKIVGHISICLSCNYLKSSPEIPAMLSHKTDLCETCYAYGFSTNARKKISKIVNELQFSHWQLNNELFDK